MLYLSYSTKRNRINNLVVGVADLSVNMNSACITMQQLSNSAEYCCKWLVASISVFHMGSRACQYLSHLFVKYFAPVI